MQPCPAVVFQDVSPLQLDVFLKLTQLVENNLWVGDPEQSIYAFRGADPYLMQAVLRRVPDDKKGILKHSYRSRMALIAFTNAIFCKALGGSMDSKAIALEPGPHKITGRISEKEDALLPAVNYWRFVGEGKVNKIHIQEALVMRIHKLIEDQVPIYDKHLQVYRPVSYGDIAILCRTNSECQGVGRQLSMAGSLPPQLDSG